MLDDESKATQQNLTISKWQALKIAEEDMNSGEAFHAYSQDARNKFDVTIAAFPNEENNWVVKYHLPYESQMQGGGPYFFISAEDGSIVTRKYYQ